MSIICALAVTALFFSGIIGIGTYAGPLLAVWVSLPIMNKYGKKNFLLMYLAISLLSILLITDKELVLFYIGFGWYPSIREKLNSMKSRFLRIVLKTLIFLVVVSLITLVTFFILGITEITTTKMWILAAYMFAGIFIFFLADKSMDIMAKNLTEKMKRII